MNSLLCFGVYYSSIVAQPTAAHGSSLHRASLCCCAAHKIYQSHQEVMEPGYVGTV